MFSARTVIETSWRRLSLTPSSQMPRTHTNLENSRGDGVGPFDNSVDDYNFSMRVRHCLRSAHIRTLRELLVRTEEELLQGRHCGRIALNEIKEVLAAIGLRLGMRDDDLNTFD